MPPPDFLLFEIPVYRTSPEVHGRLVRDKTEAYLQAGRESRARLGLVETPSEETARTAWFLDQEFFRGGWRYNQVVGWICLQAWASRLDGYYWWRQAKRFDWRGSNKHFQWRGKAFELTIAADASSEEILADVRGSLSRLAAERAFRGRYIDRRAFDNLAERLDWRRIMDDVHALWYDGEPDADPRS